jgi:inner membrane protease subunit 2
MAARQLLARARAYRPGVAMNVALNLAGWATWIPVIAMFNLYVADLTIVNGPSMSPLMNTDRDSTLRRDVVLNWKWQPRADLERGMIVTLR